MLLVAWSWTKSPVDLVGVKADPIASFMIL